MNRTTLSVLGVRLALPAITFVSNLGLLRFFGADRFAVLASLLQGALLASVVLKRGRDDALLYGQVAEVGRGRELWRAALPVLLLVVMVWIPPAQVSRWAGAVALLQMLGLGWLNAELTVAAMRLQVLDGRIWRGNLVFALIGPLSSWAGYQALATWRATNPATDGAWFGAGLALGYLAALVLMRRPASTGALLPNAGAATRAGPASRDLWWLQMIDVVLLSGDLILLGLLDRREGLGLYIASLRLAVAGAFVNLALEQAMATVVRKGGVWRWPAWLLPGAQLLAIPPYLLLLSLAGLQDGIHFDRPALCVVLVGLALQSAALPAKVRWAGLRPAAVLPGRLPVLLLGLIAVSGALTWAGLAAGWSAAVRAAVFATLALLMRAELARRMARAIRPREV